MDKQDFQWVTDCLNLIASGDLNAAMEKISSHPVNDALQPLKLHLFGLLSIRMTNFVEALNLFKKASELAPLAKIHFEAASYCATKLGMLSDSVFYLKMSATCPDPTQFEEKLLPEWMGAVEDQLANIQDRPFLLKAEKAFVQERYADTLHHLQQALNADPFHVDSWLLIQKVMLRLDRRFDSVHAVQAALDAGNVDAISAAKAAIMASRLGMVESDLLFNKAYAQQQSYNNKYVELCELEASSLKSDQQQNNQNKEHDYLKELNKIQFSDNVISLDNQVNLGLFSGRFNSGQGLDFMVNFVLDLMSFVKSPWLAIRVFSNSDYDDFQTNRLRTNAKDYRRVEMIDPVTLSRIFRNERLHLLWDLDGIRHTGAPQIHQETMLPYRLIVDEKAKTPEMKALVGTGQYSMKNLPIALPRNFDVSKFTPTKNVERKTILVSVNPCEISDGLLGMLEHVKQQAPFFDLLLDTRKMGGVSFVEEIEKKFVEKNLGNFIQFNEVGEYAAEYVEEIYSKADYILTSSNWDSLQALYHGITHNCNVLVYEIGDNTLIQNSLIELGLSDRFFVDLQRLADKLVEELKDHDEYEKTLKLQNEMLIEYASMDQRYKKVQSFVSFIETRIREVYGDDHMSYILEEA